MHFVNWTNQLAMHQSALMRGMVELGWQVTMVVAEDVSPYRRSIGWYVPDFSGVNVVIAPDKKTIARVLTENPENNVHTFGAAIGYSWGRYALLKAARMNCRLGLMMEAADPDGWKAPLRWIKYSGMRLLLGRHIHFVLGMGNLGVQWFRKCGYPEDRVFSFGYFIEQSENIPLSQGISHAFQILFVGQLITRKRVDILIRSFAHVASDVVHLSIVGDGPERKRLQGLAEQLGIAENITWHGSLPNQKTRMLIAEADLLVLPSRYDGWGAVINEALMAGTPVICTDHCGAADLLHESWRGEVVPRNDPEALAAALRRRVEQGRVTPSLRSRLRTWSDCITGKSAAAYLIAIINHVYNGDPRPLPPWER